MKKKSVAIAIGTELLVIVLLFPYLKSQVTAYNREKDSLNALRTKMAALQEIASKISELKEKKYKIESQWAKSASLLAREDKISSILKQIVSAASKAGVKVISTMPSFSKEEGARTISVEESVEGGQERIVRFLYELETKSSFNNIENIQIRPNAETLGILSAFIKMSATIYADESNAGSSLGTDELIAAAQSILNSADPSKPISSQESYQASARRSVFVPIYVTIKPKVVEPPIPPPPYSVTGILPGEKTMAILKDNRTADTIMVKIGDSLDGGTYTVESIAKNEVSVMDKKGKLTALKLYE